jgi:hypothetical protein
VNLRPWRPRREAASLSRRTQQCGCSGAVFGPGNEAAVSKQARAAERRDAPVEALELKMLHDIPIVINVRLAGDPACSTDPAESPGF